jgi:uncharacterized protein DUF4277
MSAAVPLQTQVIGALPVIQAYFDKLQLADTIDRLVPWEGEVPLGTLTEILVANRLLGPKPLYRLGQWAEQAGLTGFYQVSAAQLNDDLFGRALERLARHAPDAEAALVLGAVKGFDLDLAQVHYDITTAEFFGAYLNYVGQSAAVDGQQAQGSATADYQPPVPSYGRSKSGRKNLKQVQLGLNVLGDGAVPVGHTVLDGNTAEATTHQANLKRLKAVLPTSRFLLISDSKGDTEGNLLRVKAENCEFLCTGAFTPALQQRYLKLKDKMHKIDYYPKSQEQLPPPERDKYTAHEVEELLQGQVDGRKVRLRYRLIFVWSQSRARQQEQTRERHVSKIRREFEKITKNLNKYKLKTRQAIVARLEKAKGKYKEGALFHYDLSGQEGELQLSWRLDEKGLQEWKDLEGVYVLKTIPSKVTESPAKIKPSNRIGTWPKRGSHVAGADLRAIRAAQSVRCDVPCHPRIRPLSECVGRAVPAPSRQAIHPRAALLLHGRFDEFGGHLHLLLCPRRLCR